MTQEETRLFLEGLSEALREIQRRGIASQIDIERDTGIDQTVISRAKNKQLKRVTDTARRLRKYADMRLGDMPIKPTVLGAARAFYGAGGTEDELIASIKLVTELVGKRSR